MSDNVAQAANSLQLFRFIQADLNGHSLKASSSSSGFSTPISSSESSLAEPTFPKSLYLIQPLYNTYELNPVATNAQESVPVPDGLDLDMWIVPPPVEVVPEELVEKVKKSKKGKLKAKEEDGEGRKSGKKKRKKAQPDLESDVLAPPEVEETPEEIAERERVSLPAIHIMKVEIDNLYLRKRQIVRLNYEMIHITSLMISQSLPKMKSIPYLSSD